jgi:hypothetical protein
MSVPTSSSRQYNYKKPSSFNFVSLLFLLALVAGGYWAVKFGPVYWNRFKAEEILREGAAEASGIRRMNEAAQLQIEQKVIAGVLDRLESRGIGAEQDAKVFFTDNDASLELTYVVTVKHPGGKRTVIHVHRSAEVSP